MVIAELIIYHNSDCRDIGNTCSNVVDNTRTKGFSFLGTLGTTCLPTALHSFTHRIGDSVAPSTFSLGDDFDYFHDSVTYDETMANHRTFDNALACWGSSFCVSTFWPFPFTGCTPFCRAPFWISHYLHFEGEAQIHTDLYALRDECDFFSDIPAG